MEWSGCEPDRPGDWPSPPPLRTASLRLGDETILLLTGELDLATVGDVTVAADKCLSHKPALLSVDVGGLDFCDCAGLRALRQAKTWAHEAGVAFRLLSTDNSTRRLITLAAADDLLAALAGPVPPGTAAVAAQA